MNKMFLSFYALSVIMLILSPTIALADNESYVSLEVGQFQPTGDLADEDFEDGSSFGITVGKKVSDVAAVEGYIGRYTTKFKDEGIDPILGYWEEKDTITVTPLLLTLKGSAVQGSTEFYGGAGMGLYFANAEVNLKVLGESIDASAEDSVFGYHVLAGLNYNASDTFIIGLQAKILWTNEAKFKDTIYVAGIPIDIEEELALDGNIIALNVGYRF